MDYTSKNGKLTLADTDLQAELNRYQRITGKTCPLDVQQVIDLISEWDDDKDDTEFVQAFETYEHDIQTADRTSTESIEHVAGRSDN